MSVVGGLFLIQLKFRGSVVEPEIFIRDFLGSHQELLQSEGSLRRYS